MLLSGGALTGSHWEGGEKSSKREFTEAASDAVIPVLVYTLIAPLATTALLPVQTKGAVKLALECAGLQAVGGASTGFMR
jgi:hypothetical protein